MAARFVFFLVLGGCATDAVDIGPAEAVDAKDDEVAERDPDRVERCLHELDACMGNQGGSPTPACYAAYMTCLDSDPVGWAEDECWESRSTCLTHSPDASCDGRCDDAYDLCIVDANDGTPGGVRFTFPACSKPWGIVAGPIVAD